MSHRRSVRLPDVCLAVAAVAVLHGCGGQGAPPPRGPAEVGVVTLAPERLTVTRELPGRTSAYLVAEIRPQVSGLLQQRRFTEGAGVRAGELLDQIDPAPYQAAVDQAAALERSFQTEGSHHATRIWMVAAVASTWLSLAADVEGLALARSTLDAYRASAELIGSSRDAGVASDLDLAQAQSQVDGARAPVAAFTGRLATGRNALDALVGSPVSAELLPEGLSAVTALPELEPGVPSEVLLERPDILAAEHALRAANATIGAARAAFFPSISLTADVGTMSSHLSDLFGSGSGTWTFTPQIVAPIFASGALKANLEATEVDREIALARYERTIQVAFAEVADALALRAALLEQRQAEEALARDLEVAARLSEARYQAGIDSDLAVLVAQRSLFAARQALVNVRLAEQLNLVELYKALGGGVEQVER